MLDQVRGALGAAIGEALEALQAGGERVVLEVPPRRQLGDLAWAGALPLAKTLRRAPRAIAEDIAARVGAVIAGAPEGTPLALVEPTAAVEGPGFVNFRLRRGATLSWILGSGGNEATDGGRSVAAPPKTIVEHTNINPNKAAHIGHLRNAVLGDTLVRCLRWLGHPVEVQNYVDDTGVQVADVVVGFLHLAEDDLRAALAPFWPEVSGADPGARARALRAFAAREHEKTLLLPGLGEGDFDDLCWELYPRVTRWYDQEPAALAHRAAVLHALEGGHPAGMTLADACASLASALASSSPSGLDAESGAIARLAAAIAEWNLRCHLETMGRLAIAYDVLPHESDILHRGFWRRAFEMLRAAGAIRLESEGKNAGCWVMSLADSPEFAGMADADKILVRSNGTITYTGKDIAYQLWKLGLLRDDDGSLHDFGYREFARYHSSGPTAPVRYGDRGRPLCRTTADPAERPEGVSFGAGEHVTNVIDVRQSYPQKVVREAIRVLGHPKAAENSVHFAYEMVALTPAAVRRLELTQGLDFGLSAEDLAKPFVEMSGRRGIGVKADALLATLVAEAEKAIAARLGDGGPLPAAELTARARAIAVGALRYQMARQGRNRVLAFDFEEALAFEGDTGPYLQYSAVRARKIFDRLAERGLAGSREADAAAALAATVPDDLWELVHACARTAEVAAKAVESLEFSLLAAHARDLAQLFHKLYHEHPVLHAEDEALRALRRAAFRVYADTVAEILEKLLGIPVPAEM